CFLHVFFGRPLSANSNASLSVSPRALPPAFFSAPPFYDIMLALQRIRRAAQAAMPQEQTNTRRKTQGPWRGHHRLRGGVRAVFPDLSPAYAGGLRPRLRAEPLWRRGRARDGAGAGPEHSLPGEREPAKGAGPDRRP